MLWALALLGLVPAALTVADLGEKAADEPDDEVQSTDGLEAGNKSEMSDGSEDLLTIADASEEDESLTATEPEIGAEAGDDYLVTRGSGETVFSDFTAEEDLITLRLEGDGEGAFAVKPMLDENAKPIGISLSYVVEQDETILSFPGHDVLPTGDISVERVDPENGDTVLYTLSELGDFGPIAPNDPSVADEAGPEGAEDDVVLVPNDPDLPDEAGPAGREDGAVLMPEGAEVYATGASTGEGADMLYGSPSNDMLLLDTQDMASGGAGADEFWLDIGVAPVANAVVITDFAEGEDMLRIILDPSDDYVRAANVEVRVTEDGHSSQVTINGAVVAVLRGAPNVTLDDVVVEISSETFPEI